MADIGAIEFYRQWVRGVDRCTQDPVSADQDCHQGGEELAVFSICLWFDRLFTNGLIQDFPNVQYLSAG